MPSLVKLLLLVKCSCHFSECVNERQLRSCRGRGRGVRYEPYKQNPDIASVSNFNGDHSKNQVALASIVYPKAIINHSKESSGG